MSAAPVLEVTGLRKEFRVPRSAGGGVVHAVTDLDLTIGRSEIVGLVGESGSGKTTAGLCVLRLLDPDGGRVVLDGTDITRLSRRALRPLRPKMHMVFQDPYSALNPHMTVADIVGAPLRAQRAVARARLADTVDEMLDRVGLAPDLRGRYPHELSGGQRQRVGLARSLAVHPLLLVADEPTSALDVSVQAAILNQIADLQREFGFSCLFISHDLAVVEYLCDRIAVLYLGQVVETGTREQIFHSPRHPYTQALLSAMPEVRAADGTGGSGTGGSGTGGSGTGGSGTRRERIVLSGELPSPRDPPGGCAFHTRCPAARFPLCREQVPPVVSLTGGQWARCHLVSPLSRADCQSRMATLLASVPIVSIVTDTSSPSVSDPTPSGVPVSSTSPGSSVITELMYSTSDGTSYSSSDVRACCRTSPFTSVVMPRSDGSVPVSIHGPSGQKVSKPFARVHCPSRACKSLAVTSLAQV
jgi:oligopeptide transport system ATP-binding protein